MTAQAKVQSLMEAFNAAAQRQDVIKQAAGFHAEVCAWGALADALSPAGIPAEILADTIGRRTSAAAPIRHRRLVAGTDQRRHRRHVRRSAVRPGCPSPERWRCDATLALAIATISGLRLALLDRFDVLDIPCSHSAGDEAVPEPGRGRRDRHADRRRHAQGEAMAKTPEWLQAVWINAGQLVDQQQQAAA